MITPSIENRQTYGKIKEFFGLNRGDYPVSPPEPYSLRQKRSSRNSVLPSENYDIKVISPTTPISNEPKRKDEVNHI